MSTPVIWASQLSKDHVSGFFLKRTRILNAINLSIEKGQCFGLLGLNGSGKTTTLKLLLGLLAPSAGQVKVLDRPPNHPETLKAIGFLPENPYFYSHLTAREFLDFVGTLFALPGKEKKMRVDQLLKLVSLQDNADKPMRLFSKGMLQRLGIAQSLINDPQIIFWDEPMSGLDPVGRRDVRNILLRLKGEGKTIFFNSHLMPDVNELCDRIGILHRGSLVVDCQTREVAQAGNYRDLEAFFLDQVEQAEAKLKLAS
jgi:ABC-2 type transport system ATP-binding protein